MAAPVERRQLHFQSLNDAAADAQALAAGAVATTGKYSFGQILEHLARTIDVVTGHRQGPKIPLPLRVIARLMKSRFLYRSMQPGLRLPSKAQSVLWPSEEVEIADGLQHYVEAIERLHRATPVPVHPFLGELTREEHEQLQCRHAELHLSFARPTQ